MHTKKMGYLITVSLMCILLLTQLSHASTKQIQGLVTVPAPPGPVCTQYPNYFYPTNAILYTATDSTHIMALFITANVASQVQVMQNGAQVFPANIPAGTSNGITVNYNDNFQFNFNNEPTVLVQCTPSTSGIGILLPPRLPTWWNIQ